MNYCVSINANILKDWFYIRENQIKNSVKRLETVSPLPLDEPIFPYEIEIIAEDLYVPWALDIAKDGQIFVTERDGNIRLIENGVLQINPVYTFTAPFEAQGEGGLLGLALDEDFDNNGYLYVMYSYKGISGNNDISEGVGQRNGQSGADLFFNRVVRMHYDSANTTEDKILIDRIPGDKSHNGGRVKIGPDGKLYVTVGDVSKPELAQDMNSLAGKILRLETDGSIPSDNPFPDSYIYALGLRNSQGLDWKEHKDLYASDHGNVAHDEINLIIPGGNYGWPIIEGNEETNDQGFLPPVINSGESTWAPAGIAFVEDGPLKGKLFVSALRGSELLSMTLNEDGSQVLEIDSYLRNEFGRLREAYRAEDGSIYLTTSNLDGRGLPSPGDDKVIRLVPR